MLDIGVYRWIVLAASFCSHALLGMILDTTGSLHVVFLKAFNGGSGNTALATSLIGATFYGIAPVSGMLLINYPCWQIALIGALLGGLGLALSAFVNSLTMLYATFSILAGIGLGLAYMPAITIISQVFDKYRTVAFGIASAGVGIGKFLGPVLISKLEEKYAWRGTMLILGGIILNLCICAFVFYRPSVALLKIPKPFDEEDDLRGNIKPPDPTHDNDVTITGDESTKVDGTVDLNNLKNKSGGSGVGTFADGISQDRFGYADSNYSLVISEALNSGMHPQNGHCRILNLDTERGESEIIENFKKDLAIEGNLTSIAAALSTSSLFLSTTDAVSVEHLPMNKVLYKHKMNGSTHSHLFATSSYHCHSRLVSLQNLANSKDDVSALTGCKTPSCLSIPPPEDGNLNSKASSTNVQCSTSADKKRSLKWNLFLMKDPCFIILCLNSFLFGMGYSLVHVHLPAFSIHSGLSVNHGNFLLSAIGISSLVGKIGLGWASQLSRLSPMSVYTISSLLAAIATLPVPACSNFGYFMVYALFFGFMSGSFGAVLPSLVVSMTKLELLPSAYGFLLIFQAAGYLLGPSLAGWLYDGTGLYASSFYFGGSTMVLSSLVMLYPWYWQRKLAISSPVANEEENA